MLNMPGEFATSTNILVRVKMNNDAVGRVLSFSNIKGQ